MSDPAANSIEDGPSPSGLLRLSAGTPPQDGIAPDAGAWSHKPLGAALEPVLRDACDGQLSAISWFRTDWQRGGALTGYATWRGERKVVVKLPVPPAERQWLAALHDEEVTPAVYAHDSALNGYDLAWVVMEALPHGPLSSAWGGREFDLLIQAACRFYAATRRHPLQGKPDPRDWEQLMAQTRKHLRNADLPNVQRWRKALKAGKRKFHETLTVWQNRCVDDWCHGDLHLANAMTRTPAPHGPAVLIDLARVRPGHWTEDAVYFEHLYWGRMEKLEGRRIGKAIADERKTLGLPVDPQWATVAQAKRLLLAMTAPLWIGVEGNLAQLAAALEIVEGT